MQLKSNYVVQSTCWTFLNLKNLTNDFLRGNSDFLRLKSPQNRNLIVASMISYLNNLYCSLEYAFDLYKLRKLLKTLFQTCTRTELILVEIQNSINTV